jgi:hypothetical protein
LIDEVEELERYCIGGMDLSCRRISMIRKKEGRCCERTGKGTASIT